MVDLVFYLINLLFFGIPLLYYSIKLRLSIIFCLFSGDIYLFFRYFFTMLICNCLWTILWQSSWDFLNIIGNFITNQITNFFSYFLDWSFWSCLFSMIKSFWLYLPLTFLPIFLAKGQNSYPFTKIWYLGSIE